MLEKQDLQKYFQSMDISSVNLKSIDVCKYIIRLEVIKKSLNISLLEFYNLSAFGYLDKSQSRIDLDSLNFITYTEFGVGSFYLLPNDQTTFVNFLRTEIDGSPYLKISSFNFLIRVTHGLFFIECDSIKVEDNVIKVGYPTN